MASLSLAAVGCGGDDGGGSAEPDPVPADLVPGAPADWVVEVTVGSVTVTAPPEAVAAAVPMTPTRVFRTRQPLSDFGLDEPIAELVFRPAGADEAVRVEVGRENFDGTSYYVRRTGDDRVQIVLDDQIEPLLAAVPST